MGRDGHIRYSKIPTFFHSQVVLALMSQESSDEIDPERMERWYVGTIEKLKSNFNSLKSEYIKYKKYHQEQKQKWYLEIAKKRSEIEEMGIQFDRETETIKNLKLELFEEKEMKERLKIDLQTSDKYRLMYTEAQEEIDRLKYQLEQSGDDQQRNLDKIRQDYEERLEELEDEQRTRVSSNENIQQLQERVKSLTFQLSASKARQEEQMKEIENLRSEKLKEFRDYEQKTQHLNTRVQQLSQSQRQMHLQLSKTSVREKQLEIQLKDISGESEKLQQSNLTLTKRVSELQHLISENEHNFSLQRKEHEMENTKTIRQKDIEIERLQGKLRLIERDYESLQNQVEDLENQAKVMDEKYENKYQSLMQKEFSQLARFKQDKADVEFRLSEAERHSSQQEKIWSNEKERQRRALDELRRQISDREEETNRVQDRMEHLQEIILKMKQERISVEEELDSWKKKEMNHEMEKERLKEEHSRTQQKLKKLKVKMEYKEREQIDLLNQLETWRKKKKGMAEQEGLGLTRMKQVEKRKNQYKEMCQDLRKKMKRKVRQYQTLVAQKTRNYEHMIQDYKKKEDVLHEQIGSLRKTIHRMKRENERMFQLQGMMGNGSQMMGMERSFMSEEPVQLNNSYVQKSFGENNLSMNNIMDDIQNLNQEVNKFLLL